MTVGSHIVVPFLPGQTPDGGPVFRSKKSPASQARRAEVCNLSSAVYTPRLAVARPLCPSRRAWASVTSNNWGKIRNASTRCLLT